MMVMMMDALNTDFNKVDVINELIDALSTCVLEEKTVESKRKEYNRMAIYLDQIRAQFENDEEVVQEIVEIFLEQLAGKLASIERAIGEENATKLKEASHLMKGEFLNLGLSQLSSLAFQLEDLARSANFRKATTVYESLSKEILILRENLSILKG